MKESKNKEAANNQGDPKNYYDKDSSEPSTSTSEKTPEKGDDESKKPEEVYIREGHGHDYSAPVAGEDGGTEDQTESKTEKKDTDKPQAAEQGKTPGENSTI